MPLFQPTTYRDRLHTATADAMAKADVLVAQLSSEDKPHLDFSRVARLLNMLGLKPRVAAEGELPRARLSSLDHARMTVLVAPTLSIPEIREQLVLEVGYHLLYPEHDRSAAADRDTWFRDEVAAAWARAYLLPRASLPDDLDSIDGPTGFLNLCAVLGVTPDTMEQRILELHDHGAA